MVPEVSRRKFLQTAAQAGVAGLAGAGLVETLATKQVDKIYQSIDQFKPKELLHFPGATTTAEITREVVPSQMKGNVERWKTPRAVNLFSEHADPFGSARSPVSIDLGTFPDIEPPRLTRDGADIELWPQIPPDITNSPAEVVEVAAGNYTQKIIDKVRVSGGFLSGLAANLEERGWVKLNASWKEVAVVMTDTVGHLVSKLSEQRDKSLEFYQTGLDQESSAKWTLGVSTVAALVGLGAVVSSEKNKKMPRRSFLGKAGLLISGILLGKGGLEKKDAQEAAQSFAKNFNLLAFTDWQPEPKDSDNPAWYLDIFYTKLQSDLGEVPLYAAVLLRDILSVYKQKAFQTINKEANIQVWGKDHQQQVGLELLEPEQLLELLQQLLKKYSPFYQSYLKFEELATAQIAYLKKDGEKFVDNGIEFFVFPKIVKLLEEYWK